MFVRQNIAEIDDFPCKEVIHHVTLPPAERAIYLELEHLLHPLDMDMSKAVKQRTRSGDREKRQYDILGTSKSGQEAILKRCSYLDAHNSNKVASLESDFRDSGSVCTVIVNERRRQLDECKVELISQLDKCKAIAAKILRADNSNDDDCCSEFFAIWKIDVEEGGVGIPEATKLLREKLIAAKPSKKTKTGKRERRTMSQYCTVKEVRVSTRPIANRRSATKEMKVHTTATLKALWRFCEDTQVM